MKKVNHINKTVYIALVSILYFVNPSFAQEITNNLKSVIVANDTMVNSMASIPVGFEATASDGENYLNHTLPIEKKNARNKKLIFENNIPQSNGEDEKITINGIAELDHISYLKFKPLKINYRFQSLLDTKFKIDLNDIGKLTGNIEIRSDLADSRRNRIFLDDFYVDLFFKKLDLRIGRQNIKWGEADGLNPTNNFNGTDFSDILDTEREELPIYGIRAKLYATESVQLDAVTSFYFTPSILPDNLDSRWIPTGLPNRLPHPLAPPPAMLNVGYQFDSGKKAINALKLSDHIQAGVRLSFQFENQNGSISYFGGRNDIPYYISKVNQINYDSIQINLIPNYHKWYAIGHDYSTIVGDFGIRGEAAFVLSEKVDFFEKQKNFYHYVLGIDKTIFGLFGGQNSLFIILQWSQQLLLTGGTFDTNDINHIFQRAALLRLEQTIGTYSKLHVQFVYDTLGKGYYIQPKFSSAIADGINIIVLMDILGGREGGFFNQYDDNDRFQMKLEFNF